ncbi:TRAP transporter substrate-binding protein [Planococcus versutus]|uniref:C4-dicarboxylate ABC transporter substrate-binding protein n=1 Tax=Planococcus versutus TaxID=1302659 RepID=A0A1B1S1L9_9BACL|nr:TRAP transporter substrate-binding protein [Planococcus versutus]ANU27049.1 hypothetical protein I858_008605 [Planococcus versutus]
MKKWSLIFILFTLMLLVAACGEDSGGESTEAKEGNSDEKFVIKAGHAASEEHFAQDTFEEFKKIVEKDSNGRIEVEIYPNGQLGGEREMVEAVQLGNLTMAAPSSAVLTAFSPGMFLWDLPFLFDSPEIAHEVLDGEIGQEVLDDLSEVGITGLGYWENGFRHLMNGKKPVTTIEDMDGLKMRTLESQQQIEAWDATGANSTPIAFTELYSALQQGTVDAAEGPLALIYAQKFYEVQDYLTLTGHMYSPWPVIINQQFMESLPEDLQEVVKDAVIETRTVNRQLSADDEAASLDLLKEGGMEVEELSTEEKAKFTEAMKVVYPDIKDLAGEDIYNRLMKAVE